LKGRAFVSILCVAATATLSAVLLWTTLQGGGLGQLGLAGAFLASLLSHLTVVARDMFVPMFLPLASVYNPLLLGAAAGWDGAGPSARSPPTSSAGGLPSPFGTSRAGRMTGSQVG